MGKHWKGKCITAFALSLSLVLAESSVAGAAIRLNDTATQWDTNLQYASGIQKEQDTGTPQNVSGNDEHSKVAIRSDNDHSAPITNMQADTKNNTARLEKLVQQMFTSQGEQIARADNMWIYLASGSYTVTPDVKEQAQAAIAEDGYWGVEQTSARILDFITALAGNDSSKADDFREAFEKGYQKATKTWGKKLPDVTTRTYDAVAEKLENWKNGTE